MLSVKGKEKVPELCWEQVQANGAGKGPQCSEVIIICFPLPFLRSPPAFWSTQTLRCKQITPKQEGFGPVCPVATHYSPFGNAKLPFFQPLNL